MTDKESRFLSGEGQYGGMYWKASPSSMQGKFNRLGTEKLAKAGTLNSVTR